MPRVAVISPYFNRAQAVALTFDSISQQTFVDFEALFWDDGSTDGTWEEMKRVAEKLSDPRFRLVQFRENIGLTAGLNYAIANTDSDYIAVVGSGDECAPMRLERQVSLMDANPQYCFCATHSKTVDPVSGATFSDSSHTGTIINFEDIRTVCPFTHGTVMYRRSSLPKEGPYEEVFEWCADWDLFFRLLKGGTAGFIEDVLYTRYARADGVSFSPAKAIAQIKNKHLAMVLSEIDLDERDSIIRKVKDFGLDSVLKAREPFIRRDLHRRDVKLALMGRSDEAKVLERLIQENYGFRLIDLAVLRLAVLLGKLPLRTDAVLNITRRMSSTRG